MASVWLADYQVIFKVRISCHAVLASVIRGIMQILHKYIVNLVCNLSRMALHYTYSQ